MERGTGGVSFLLVLTPFLFLNSTILFGAEWVDPVAIAEQVLIDEDDSVNCVKFCPDKSGEIEQTLIGLIRDSERIQGALYLLSKRSLIDELVAAHKRGIPVDLVFDPSALSAKAIYALPKAGIPLQICVADDFTAKRFAALMHLKCLIFTGALERTIVASGSMNFTNNGLGKNQDQITFTDNPAIVEEYSGRVEQLLASSEVQVQSGVKRKPKKLKKEKNKLGKRSYHTSVRKKFLAKKVVRYVRYVKYVK